MHCDVGVVGLGVMGANLALNMERNGFRIAGYDLDAAKGQAFVAGPAAGRHVELAPSPDRLMAMLEAPAPRPDDGARRRRRRQRHRASQAAPAAWRHPDRRRQLVVSRHRAPQQGTRRRRVPLRRHGRVRRRAGRAVGPGHHARRPARRPGRRWRPSCGRSPRRPTMASRAWTTWARAAPGTTSRWSTTASSTATCSSSPRRTTCSRAALRLPARELSAIFQEWNAGDLRSYLIEITAEVLAQDGPGDRPPAGGSHPRRGAAEGHGQVDEPARLRHRRADSHHQRRRREPHPVGAQGRSASARAASCTGRRRTTTAGASAWWRRCAGPSMPAR